MGIFDFLKKKPTPGEQERLNKKAAAEERQRAEDNIRELQLMTASLRSVPGLDNLQRKQLLDAMQAVISLINSKSFVDFDTKPYDDDAEVIIENMKASVDQRSGSFDTYMSCLQGIAYNYRDVRAAVPNPRFRDETLEKRAIMLSRYKSISILCRDIDQQRKSIEDKEKQLEDLNFDFQRKMAEVKQHLKEHPEDIVVTEELTADEASKLTPSAKALATKYRAVVLNRKNIKIEESLIAEDKRSIVEKDGRVTVLRTELDHWESALDEQTMEEMRAADEAFKKKILEGQRRTKELEASLERTSLMIDEALNGAETKEYVIKSAMDYKAMLEEDEESLQEKRRGQKIIEEEQQRQEEPQRQVNESVSETQQNEEEMLENGDY